MRVFAISASVAVLLLSVLSAFGQTPQPLAFVSADVHSVPASANPVLAGALSGTSRFELHGATMVDLIRFAWNVDASRIAGGPSWLATNRFDIVAATPGPVTREQSAAMLRTLLADRFKLVIRNDTRSIPAFVMTVAKAGPKLKKSVAAEKSGCAAKTAPAPQDGPAAQTYVCQGVTMAAFADSLPGIGGIYFLGNPLVADQTHLDGAWDFSFQFTPRGLVAVEGTTLFEATEKQLGLHLELGRAPVPVIVVESVNEKPTDNAPGVTEALRPTAREFEVALLKPSEPGATQMRVSLQGGKVDLQNVTLRALITVSWNLTNDKIVGLPDFVDSDRYDIKANPPAGVDSGIDSLRIMMQALLKERFGLKTHNEDRPVDVYALLAPRSKLKKAHPANRSDCQNAVNVSTALMRTITCQNTTMEQFAAALKRMAGGYFSTRAVVDATGVEGAWDLTLNFSPAAAVQTAPADPGAAAPDPNGAISIFDAVDKQLGLKLETQKRPMPVLVVDHIERKPSDN